MRRTLGSPLALVATAFLLHAGGTQAQVVADAGTLQFTDEELENLLAPVALYPDPILAQVLVAASYPDEVDLAARHVSVYGESGIDDQPWDISVKSVARYEPVLNLMADRLDWTTALGQAYAEQPEDVMAAVQSLRAMAHAQGNLVTTEQHEVVVEDHDIRIIPAHPRVVYVPVYDPLVVYHRPIVHLGAYGGGWSFGFGFPIGVWLSYDLDWGRHHIYYHGWHPHYRVGWIHRSRPFIVVNHIYVQHRPRVVVANHRVINRYVDYRRFARYNTVHRRVAWERHERQAVRRYADDAQSRDTDYDRAGRNPSWDRSGRMRAYDDDGRRAVERSSATRRSWSSDPQRVAPETRSSETRQAQPRSSTRQTYTRPPEQARPTTRSTATRSVEYRSQPERAQPQARSSRVEAQRQSSPPAQVDRSQARSTPSRAQRGTVRATPERSGRSSVSGRSSASGRSAASGGRGSSSRGRSSGRGRGSR